MKKLALALVCLVSVAFFASCTPEGNPTIRVINEEGYVQNGDVINLGEEVTFGFVMSSAIETSSPLTSLVIKIDDNDPETIELTGTSYTYEGTLVYGLEKDEIVGTSTITATVYDALGKFATTSITFSLNQAAQPLEASRFEWYRLGNTQTGLEEFGLYWENNLKATHAQIKPMEGVTLYSFSADKWEATTTDVEKAALFADGAIALTVYNNVSTSASDNYDDVIGTKMADGTLHLIHVTKCEIGSFQPQGYPITIFGEAK